MTATASRVADTTTGRGEGLSREILVLAGVVILGTIMTVLDLTVVNVAIPRWRVTWAHRSRRSVG
jgi:hypothetical protein